MELPFDVNDLESKSKLAKKPSYLGKSKDMIFKISEFPSDDLLKKDSRKNIIFLQLI